MEGTAAALIPERPTLERLQEAAAGCQACELWTRGTQTVFGEGPRSARLVLVGEQPGDREDIEGRPFVAPAGRLLDEALEKAGIDRRAVYVTNIVKHFRWEEQRSRRKSVPPGAGHVRACRPWLEAEIALIQPEMLVCLGSAAAQGLFGRDFKVSERRGQLFGSSFARQSMATIHPAAVLRARDQHVEKTRSIEDIQLAASALQP